MSRRVFLISFFSFLACLLLAVPTLADDSPWLGGGSSSIESNKSKNSAQELNEMLKGFEQGCSVGSAGLTEAFNVVETLRTAIATARSSKNCENLNEVMVELNSSYQNARSLYPSEFDRLNSSTEKIIASLESRKKNILFLISQSSDPDEIQQLKNDLRNTETELSQYYGENAAQEYNDKRIRKMQALTLITNTTYQSLNTILNNKKCLVDQPELLENISAISLGIGNTLAALSPVGAAATFIGWGAGLTSSLLQYFEEKSEQKKLMDFDIAHLPISMTCTIEKLNELYCAAEDTLIALEKYQKYSERSQSSQKDPIWIGAQITNRSLPIAFNWLERLKSGSTPSNPSDASKFNMIDDLEALLRKGVTTMEGYVTEYERNFNAGASRDLLWIDLRKLVTNIVNTSCLDSYSAGATSVVNPICEFKTKDMMKFYLIGIKSEITYDRLKKENPYVGDLFEHYRSLNTLEENINSCADCPKESVSFVGNHIRENYRQLHRLGEDRLNIIKQREGQGDLAVIFATAKGFSTAQSQFNQKPLRAFQNLHRFLSDSPSVEIGQKSSNRSGQRLINETMGVLQIIIDNIECATNNTCDLFEARARIIDATEVSKDSSKLATRVRYLVKNLVDYQVYENSNIEDNWQIQYMASRDYLNDLQRFYTSGNSKILLKKQAETIQYTISNATKNFQKNYSQILKTTFEHINKNASQDSRGFASIKESLCYQTLGLKWDDMFKPCIGQEAQPLKAKGKKAPKITRDLYNQDRRLKSCYYRNYLRQNYLIEKHSGRTEF